MVRRNGWSTGTVPTSNDSVSITAGGTYTITIGSNGGMPAAAGTLALNAAGATLDDTGILSLGTTFSIASGNFILDAGGVLDLSGTGASVSVAGTTSFASFAGSSAGSIKLTGSGATLTEIGNQTLSKRHAHDGQLYDR